MEDEVERLRQENDLASTAAEQSEEDNKKHHQLLQQIADLEGQLVEAKRSEASVQLRVSELQDEIKNLKSLEEVGEIIIIC